MGVKRIGGSESPQMFAEPASVQANAGLTQISLDYRAGGHIADLVMPRVNVGKVKGQYAEFGREAFNTESSTTNAGIRRAPRTSFARTDFAVSWEDYECSEYGIEIPIGWTERETADPAIDLDVAATERCTGVVLNEREQRVAAILTSTSVVTQNTTLSGTDQWDQYSESDSDPLGDIDTGRQAIHRNSGVNPNVLLLGREVYDKLKRHPLIQDYFKYTEGGAVTPKMLSAAFGIDRVYVGDALYNSATGTGFTGSYIWGSDAILLHVPENPGIMQPAAGYQIMFDDLVTEQFREEALRQDVVRVRETTDEVLVSEECCYLIKDAVA
jgi:hypothetical protein